MEKHQKQAMEKGLGKLETLSGQGAVCAPAVALENLPGKSGQETTRN